MAWFAVDMAPERIPASTTTVTSAKAATRRLRVRNIRLAGRAEQGCSLMIIPPASKIWVNSAAFIAG